MNNPRQTLQRIGLNFPPLFLTSLFCSRVKSQKSWIQTPFMSRLWRWDSNCRVMFTFSLLFTVQHGLPGVVCRMSNLIKLFALFFYRTQLDKCRKWSSIRTRISQEDPTVSIFFQFANSFGREIFFFFRGAVTRQETKQNNFFRISCSRIVQGDPAVSIFCQFSNFLGAKTMFFFHLQVWRHVAMEQFDRRIGAARNGKTRY